MPKKNEKPIHNYYYNYFWVKLQMPDGTEKKFSIRTDGWRPLEGKKVTGPFGKRGAEITATILHVEQRTPIPLIQIDCGNDFPAFTDNPLW